MYEGLCDSFTQAFVDCAEKFRKQGWQLVVADEDEFRYWLSEYVGDFMHDYVRKRTIWQQCEKSR
jgi:hypothetical protein